jgi:biotin-dependent carboxylase-like uncharacterized protein
MAVNGSAHLPAGAEITLRSPQDGLRYYLAVRGGFDVAPVLGSCSLDTLAAIGPRLASGDRFGIGADPNTPLVADLAMPPPLSTLIHLYEGPRRDWFTDDAWTQLITQAFVVSASSNRVGARLTGPLLERRHDHQLPSEGLVEGAIEVPPDGQPIVMLADCPVTGGYPVIAVVDRDHLSWVAQARPGTTLRFRHSGG